MLGPVYRTIAVVCRLLEGVPLGTNLGRWTLFWMLLSGQLLASRGAVIPGLAALGVGAPAVRRAWAALGQGAWSTGELVTRWHDFVVHEGHWQVHRHGRWRPVAAGGGRWRPT